MNITWQENSPQELAIFLELNIHWIKLWLPGPDELTGIETYTDWLTGSLTATDVRKTEVTISQRLVWSLLGSLEVRWEVTGERWQVRGKRKVKSSSREVIGGGREDPGDV
jgi:hypothetical protein